MCGLKRTQTQGRYRPPRRLIVLGLLAVLLIAIPALAVHDAGLMELDGNIAHDTATDWGDLFSSGNPGGTALTLPSGAVNDVFVHDGSCNNGSCHDATAADSTFFATGAKDTLDISSGWQCTSVNQPLDKDDINHVYAIIFKPTSGNKSGHTIIYMAMERKDNTGAGEIAFWILQDPTVGCTAPATGAANFTGAHQTGDILVVSEFTNGGVINSIAVYEWSAGALNTTAIATGVDCASAAANDNVCGKVNTANITSPWANKFKGQSSCSSSCTVETSEFYEIGLDATALLGSSFCSSSILGDTRTSPSLTADLKDYALGSLSCKSTPTASTNIHDSSHTVITSAPIGTSVHDSATVSSSNGTPTGAVTFSLYNNTSCTGSPTSTQTVTLSSGTAESSSTTVPNTGLSYQATYNGDSDFKSATSACEPLPATKLTPTVTTDVHDSSHNVITTAPIGTSVHDKATVSGSAGTPTGTVTFSLYNNTSCTGSPTSTQTVTLSSGTAESSSTTLTSSGLSYQVSYSGDSNYNTATGSCEPLSATKLTPTVTTDIHDSSHNVITSASIGTSVHDKATVSGSGPTPTGSVTFNLFSTTDCTGSSTSQTVTLSSGSAESSSTTLTSSGLSYQVSYSGDATYNAATSSCEPLSAAKLNPTVVTEIHDTDHNPITTATIGDSVHDKATVSGSGPTPTGSVTFNLFSTTDCTGSSTSETVTLSSGTAESSSTTVTSTGLSYQVSYSGDSNYTAATSDCEQLPAILLTPVVTTEVHDSSHNPVNPAPIGTSVHDKATVSGSGPTPTGTVTFTLFNTTDCTGSPASTETVTLSGGTAESSSTTVPVTGLSYQVTYNGDSNYAGAISSCEPPPIAKLDPTVVTEIHDSSHNAITSAPIGTSVHDKATVSGSSGTPTGSVTFNLYSTSDCTGSFTTETVTLVNGVAESSATTVPNTGLSYEAAYSGDATYNDATSDCEQLPAIKLNPTVVTEIHDSSHNVITSASIGSSVHDKATVSGSSGTPTGTVTFNLFSTSDCTGSSTSETVTLSSGTAESSSTTVPSTGLSYEVSYSGDNNYTTATSACEQLPAIKLDPTVVTEIHDSSHNVITSASIGSSVHDKATVSGSGPTPTGSVTFMLFSTTDCTGSSTSETVTLSSGTAESSSTTVPSTGLSYQVSYSGDSNYNTATGSCESLPETKLNPTVTTEVHDSSHNVITSAPIGSSVHDKATVSGSGSTPTGSVTFKLFSTTDCTGSSTSETVTLSSGTAESSSTTVLSTGLSYQVSYSGDSNYNTATSACEPLPATKLPSTVATQIHDVNHNVITSAAANSSVHDKATVTGSGPAPTGTVTFKLFSTKDCTGSSTSETVTLSSGTAESSSTTVSGAGLSYQANYSGDANYTGSTGVCEPLTATGANGSIQGFKWLDLDGNGSRSGNEPGVAGITITLTGTDSSGNPINRTTVTDAQGNFSFLNLPPGTYTICEIPPPGSVQTFPTSGPICTNASLGWTIVLQAGENRDRVKFGNTLDDPHWDVLSVQGVQALVRSDAIGFFASGHGIKDVQVQLYDLRGKSIYSSGWQPSGWAWKLQNLKNQRVARGVYLYIVTVRGQNGEVVKTKLQKLIVR